MHLFEIGFHTSQEALELIYVSETGLERLTFLPPIPKCWHYRCAPLYLALWQLYLQNHLGWQQIDSPHPLSLTACNIFTKIFAKINKIKSVIVSRKLDRHFY